LDNFSVCRRVEAQVKILVQELKIKQVYEGQEEVFRTTATYTLDQVLGFIDGYVDAAKQETDKNKSADLDKYKFDRVLEADKHMFDEMLEADKRKFDETLAADKHQFDELIRTYLAELE